MRTSVVLALLAACYAPSPATGIPCGDGMACPTPLVCAPATNTCERSRGDDVDAAIANEAGVDATSCATTTHDEDGDGVVDSCDNCPGIANPTQVNTTEANPDSVGDACDPRPTERDRIALFEGFATMPTGWMIDGMAVIENDRIRLPPSQGYGEVFSPKESTDGVIEMRYTVMAIDDAAAYMTVEAVAEQKEDGGIEGYRCVEGNGASPNPRGVEIQTFTDPFLVAPGMGSSPRWVVGDTGVVRFAFGGQLDCRHLSPVHTSMATEPEARTGVVGVATQYLGAAFHYIVLYEPAP